MTLGGGAVVWYHALTASTRPSASPVNYPARGFQSLVTAVRALARIVPLSEFLSCGAEGETRAGLLTGVLLPPSSSTIVLLFDIKHCENVGIVGLNGTGKSTLLKMLSPVTEPTIGISRIEGRVGVLLEVGTGFHAELTGRETFTSTARSSACARKRWRANSTPSSTPRASRSLSIRGSSVIPAACTCAWRLPWRRIDPEILLLDEVLAVGDISFQRRCMDVAKEPAVARRHYRVRVAQHVQHQDHVRERVEYLNNRPVVFEGPTEQAIALYERDSTLGALHWMPDKRETWPIEITQCEITDDSGAPRAVFDHGESMRFGLTHQIRQPLNDPNFIVASFAPTRWPVAITAPRRTAL